MSKRAHNSIDLANKIFGKLTVKEYSHTKDKECFWKCVCECGIETIKRGSNLSKGGTTSCGCNRRSTALPGKVGFNCLLLDYKIGARKRSLSFDLSEAEFKKLTQQNCHYCNIEPKQVFKSTNKKLLADTAENNKYVYNGVDRKDNSIGYELSNCVPCCTICNRAKSSISYNDFIEYIKRFK